MAIRKDQDEVQGKGMGELLTAPQPQPQEEQQPQQEAPVQTLTTPSRISSAQSTQETKPMPTQQKAGTGGFANLKKYLEAAQGGGQQRVAKAAGQQVQKLGTEAQKGITQAKETFGKRMQAGSGAFYQGATTDEAAQQAAQQAVSGVIGAVRGVTYQQPQAGQTQQYLAPTQEEQFAQAINAAYQGPQSLQEAGLYQQAAEKARTAEEAARQTQTALGRQELLRNVFGRTRDYTRGASALDALLLNTSGEAVKQLQEQAQPGLEAAKALQVEQNLSANEAARRALALGNIQKQAKEAFTGARTEEETATNEAIKKIQQNWNKLPEYFKNLLKTTGKTTGKTGDKLLDYYLGNQGKTYNLSAEEASILGLTPGQGLFGITPESIRASQAARGEELITKDQLSRQLALARLANLDVSKALQKDLLYTDLEKAGTKNIYSSLDTESLKKLREEKMKEMERDPNLLKVSSIGTSDGYKQFPLYDVLKSAGYTPSTEGGLLAEKNTEELLKAIAAGEDYAAGRTKKIPSYLENVWKQYFGKVNPTQLGWRVQDLKKILGKYGGLDTIQTIENAQTKARADALRKLLGEIS